MGSPGCGSIRLAQLSAQFIEITENPHVGNEAVDCREERRTRVHEGAAGRGNAEQRSEVSARAPQTNGRAIVVRDELT